MVKIKRDNTLIAKFIAFTDLLIRGEGMLPRML